MWRENAMEEVNKIQDAGLFLGWPKCFELYTNIWSKQYRWRVKNVQFIMYLQCGGSNYLLNFPIFVHNVTAARSNVDRFLSHNCGSRVESFIRGVGSGLWRGVGSRGQWRPPRPGALMYALRRRRRQRPRRHNTNISTHLIYCRVAPHRDAPRKKYLLKE